MTGIRDGLIELYSTRATGRYGLSDVNQLQHALQAAQLARQQGEPTSLVTAALLHDIGHMVHELGENPAAEGVDDAHEDLGAEWLKQHFGSEVTEPVRLHVPAKRYLCAIDATYFGKLSEDSVLSLGLQGGPMSAAEIAEFECLPHWREAVRLRRIDDSAKDPLAITPSLSDFAKDIDAVLKAAGK